MKRNASCLRLFVHCCIYVMGCGWPLDVCSCSLSKSGITQYIPTYLILHVVFQIEFLKTYVLNVKKKKFQTASEKYRGLGKSSRRRLSIIKWENPILQPRPPFPFPKAEYVLFSVLEIKSFFE
jgi:hypothetical protein